MLRSGFHQGTFGTRTLTRYVGPGPLDNRGSADCESRTDELASKHEGDCIMPLGRPPGPSGVPFFGSYFELKRSPTDFFLRLRQDYGEISYFRLAHQHVTLLTRPDFVQEVLMTHESNFTKSRILQRAKRVLGEGLLTSEGEFHLRQRRLAQPAFHRERLVGYGETMCTVAARACERWRDGEQVDMGREMLRITLAIVGLTLFSTDVEGDAVEIGRAMSALFATFELMVLPFADYLHLLPLPAMRRAERARRQLDRYIYDMIERRRRSGEDTGDLLSTLLLAVDAEGGTGSMTDKQVRDEALTLFLAGHETTAVALTWAWYLLATHPEAEARFHEELTRVLGERLPTPSDLPALEYSERVFAETLRLYPPAWAIGRMAKKPIRIYNYEIRGGDVCIVSPFVTHRDPRWWPDPERFEPDRFLPEAKQGRPRFAYFPFGGGTRVCIGERFAWMEAVLVLATLGQRWRWRLVPGQNIGLRPQLTLRPDKPVRMIAERRGKSTNTPSDQQAVQSV